MNRNITKLIDPPFFVFPANCIAYGDEDVEPPKKNQRLTSKKPPPNATGGAGEDPTTCTDISILKRPAAAPEATNYDENGAKRPAEKRNERKAKLFHQMETAGMLPPAVKELVDKVKTDHLEGCVPFIFLSGFIIEGEKIIAPNLPTLYRTIALALGHKFSIEFIHF